MQKRQIFFRGHTKFLWAHIPLFMGEYPKRPLRLVILEFALRFCNMMSICTYIRAICAKPANFFFRGHTKFLWAYTPLFMDKFPKRPLRLVIVEFGLKSFADLSKNDYWSLKINLF